METSRWFFVTLASIYFVDKALGLCSVEYKQNGCLPQNQGKVLTNKFLFSHRDKINWNEYDKFLQRFSCLCAKAANEKGYLYFGLVFWGECWVGNDKVLFDALKRDRESKKHKCFNGNYKGCDWKSNKYCIGDKETEFIYTVVKPLIATSSAPRSPTQNTMSMELLTTTQKPKTTKSKVSPQTTHEAKTTISSRSLPIISLLTKPTQSGKWGNRKIVSKNKNGAILKCPKNKVIKVNYAKFEWKSGKNCKEMPSYGHNSSALVPLTKVKNRCEGKKQCFLSATTQIYGYSCNFTVTYLEVDYTCINWPPTCPRKSIICQNKKGTIGCPFGFIINILWANYGRLLSQVCDFNGFWNKKCYSRCSLAKVKRKCQGKTSCSLNASNNYFRDSCPGVQKYLHVKYKCKRAIILSTPITKIFCQSQNKRLLRCPMFTKIHIFSARYGRLQESHCNDDFRFNHNCQSSNSLEIVKRRCEGRWKCHIQASNILFGNPCPGTKKLLKVTYSCS